MTKNTRKYLIDCDINTKPNQDLEFYLIKTEPEEKVSVFTDNNDLYSVIVDIENDNIPLFLMEIKKLFHSWRNKNHVKEKKILSDLELLGDKLRIYKIDNSIEIQNFNLFNEAKVKNQFNINHEIKRKRTHTVLLSTLAIMSIIVGSFIAFGGY
jgi:hypothetical protein